MRPTPHRAVARAAAALLCALAFTRCSPSGETSSASRNSVITIATAVDADALIPPLVGSTQGKQAVDMLFDFLAEAKTPIVTIGDAGFGPQLASRWTWAPDSLSIAFSIDPRARWHDGTPVRAKDVAFSFALFTDPVVASMHAGNFTGIDSVTVRDSLTAVVWWHARHPEQFFQVAYNLAIMPEHLLGTVPRDSLLRSPFADHPVGSGRYRFTSWTRQGTLMFEADTANYRGAPAASRLIWVVAADPTAASLSVLAGQADVLESVRGDAYTQVRKSTTARAVEYESLDYAYMLLNHERTVAGARRLFADRALRVALTQAVDRAAIVANALDSLGRVALGPFTRATDGVDTTMRQIALDTAAAGRALDALGWTRATGDSLRRRAGRPLQFTLMVPAASTTRKRVAVLLQAQFRALGIAVEVDAVEAQVYAARLGKGDFDAALNAWRTDPSPATIRQVWATARGSDVQANYGRYSNPRFDAATDSAATTFDPARRRALYRRAYQDIVDDAAAIWLYEPRNFAAISTRVTPVGMRADAWWAALPRWQVSGAGAR
ncbi:MAG: peptide ABC transporter substrate-binding protein [Gemmatimonadaceae bacterium]|nr:peptide ABC transporter substrate-binding protein [Gemmatimonadaceae bacterium]